jgi:succinate dehydrogenase hydrophobic anchor subunit
MTIEIVILCLLLSYLVYNMALAPEANYQMWTQFLAEFMAQFQDFIKEKRA